MSSLHPSSPEGALPSAHQSGAVLDRLRGIVFTLRAREDDARRTVHFSLDYANRHAAAYFIKLGIVADAEGFDRWFHGSGNDVLAQTVLDTYITGQARAAKLPESGKRASTALLKNGPRDRRIVVVLDLPDSQENVLSSSIATSAMLERLPGVEAMPDRMADARITLFDVETGLPGRSYFLDRAAGEFQRAARYGGDVSAVALRLSADIEDEVLYERLLVVGQTIESLARTGIDLAGRTATHEISVLLPQTALSGALHFAGRLRDSLSDEITSRNGAPGRPLRIAADAVQSDDFTVMQMLNRMAGALDRP